MGNFHPCGKYRFRAMTPFVEENGSLSGGEAMKVWYTNLGGGVCPSVVASCTPQKPRTPRYYSVYCMG